MDDINFDELDKAVSSVLQKTASEDSTASAKNTTDDLVSVPQIDMPGEADTSSEQTGISDAPAAEAQSQKTSSVVLPKRRGQFMDMVHPSSDMRQGATRPVAARASAILQPLDPSVVEATSLPEQSADVSSSSEVDSADDSREQQQAQESSHVSLWPDPLDVAEKLETQESPAVSDDQSDESVGLENESDSELTYEESGQVVQEADDTEGDDAGEAESPFISGTEVEKRPLGAFATNSETSPTDKVDGSAEEALETNSAEPSVAEELSPEVVLVETERPPVVGEEVDEKYVDDSAVGTAQSISPQYTAQGASVDEGEDHAVFDTEQYHQPLTPPAKQHSKGKGLFYTLLFISMLLLGGAAGYIVWYLKLI